LQEATQVFNQWHKKSAGALRLLGFGTAGLSLTGTSQKLLFSDPDEEKQKKINEVYDKIRGKLGEDSLKRGNIRNSQKGVEIKQMIIIRLLPIFLSSLLMAAHCLRSGSSVLVGCSLAFPFLLLFPKKWAARTVQVCLLISMLEWFRTSFIIAIQRIDGGMPWIRLVVILGSVAILTGASTCVFFMKPLRDRYELGDRTK